MNLTLVCFDVPHMLILAVQQCLLFFVQSQPWSKSVSKSLLSYFLIVGWMFLLLTFDLAKTQWPCLLTYTLTTVADLPTVSALSPP